MSQAKFHVVVTLDLDPSPYRSAHSEPASWACALKQAAVDLRDSLSGVHGRLVKFAVIQGEGGKTALQMILDQTEALEKPEKPEKRPQSAKRGQGAP